MYERMLDKSAAPTIEEMKAYCGGAGELFIRFNDWLSETYQTAGKIDFPYGSRYGWGVAHRKNKKLLCNVFAESGAFAVMLRLSDRQFQAVYGGLREYAREYVDHKYPCGDGGWIHYRVTDESQLSDLQTLLSVKCSKRPDREKRIP